MVTQFYEVVPKDLADRIPKQSLETIYSKYWKEEREKRKRSFLRMFWEKADYDDNDQFSAFRKRVKQKMTLRKKTKYEIESYLKMFDLRRNCLDVLFVINDMHKREQLKKRQNILDQAIFDAQFDQMLKERGLSQIQIPRQSKLLEVKKIE